MKYALLLAIVLVSAKTFSQSHSCDYAYRFDASYSKTFDQLDNVTISLYQSKAATETAEIIKGPYYYTAGTTSSKQFQPVDANIGFKNCYVLNPNLELYKTDVKNGQRIFTIPGGSNGSASANIPIQVITPPGSMSNGRIYWGPGNFKIKFSNGYLQPGEYILIDKNSITPDGTQMKGYAFTIK
jgi:hypothetical protein